MSRTNVERLEGRSDKPGKSIGRGRWPVLAGLVILCLAIAAPIWTLWRPGVINKYDMLMAVYRVFELHQSWSEGVLYPRIALGLNFGYGGPLFEYYPPLASYLGLQFHWMGLGWIEATKAAFTLALLMAGLGAYVYARWLLSESRAALVAAIAYGIAPYLVLNILERGALSELVALALLPWLFWAMHVLLRTPSAGRMWIAAVLVALLVLAHNVTALFVIPFLAIYIILLAWHEDAWRQVPLVVLALALGLGLSAFYWLPALAERGFAKIEAGLQSSRYQPDQNLRALTSAVQPSLVFDYWAKTHFRLALWQGLVLVAGIIAIPLAPTKLRFHLAVMSGLVAVTLLLQLDPSRAFWQTMPLVRFIQFPWRLLGLSSFFVAVLLGWLLSWRPPPAAGAWLMALALMMVIVYAGIRRLEPKQLPAWTPIASSQISAQDLNARGTYLYSDYTPASMEVPAHELTLPRSAEAPPPLPAEASPTIVVVSERPDDIRLQVQAPAPFTLRLPRIYFPDWKVLADGQPMPVGPAGPFGLVTTPLPAGDYQVVARFTDTPLRRLAGLMSALCLFALLVSVAWSHKRALWIVLALVVLFGVVFGLRHSMRYSGHQPKPIAASFNRELSLLGSELAQTTVHPGDTLNLRLYWLARTAPAKDYTIFIHLIRPDDSGKVAQDDSQPSFGYSPTSRWDPGEIVVDEHQFGIDPGVPPGTYRVVAGIYSPDTLQNLPVTADQPLGQAGAAEILPGDRVSLGEIEVRAR